MSIVLQSKESLMHNYRINHELSRIRSFERRLTVARSLTRRARYGRQINAARVRLAVLRLEAE